MYTHAPYSYTAVTFLYLYFMFTSSTGTILACPNRNNGPRQNPVYCRQTFQKLKVCQCHFFLKTSEKKCWNDAVHCVQHAHNTQRAITRDQHNTNNNSQLFGSTGIVPNKANQETVVFVRIVTNTFHHVKAGSHHRHRSKNVWARP